MKKYRSVLILICIFLFMLLLNHWMPIHRDDYDYSLVWGTARHVGSFSDVITSCVNHYLFHGGRMVTVFGLDLFLWLGKWAFDLANAAFFTALVFLLACHVRRDTHALREPALLAMTALLLWLCLPHFGEVAVWKSGSTVYLWSGLCAAAFLLPYNLFLAGKISWGKSAVLPMFFLGILGGWSVENLSVTVVCVTFLSSLYAYKKRNCPLWLPAGFFGALAGFAGLLAAPGNYVRYGEQGSGKSFLIHIGNQFAGNGEMLLYILPIVLLLLLALRTLKLRLAEKRGLTLADAPRFTWTDALLLVLLAIFILSYATGGWAADAIRDFLIGNVLAPAGITRPKTIAQFSHVMAGFEEMAIYLLGIFSVYTLTKALGLSKRAVRGLNKEIKKRELWEIHPSIRYTAVLFALALFNNFVMIAAPTFPVRATFSSVCMIIVGTLALLRLPEIKETLFVGKPGKILKTGATLAFLLTASATLALSVLLSGENDARIATLEAKAGSGEIVAFPPLPIQNRALRHIFFVDFDNGVTKGGLCKYYGVKDIRVEK